MQMRSSSTNDAIISGCYILILNLDTKTRINIGKLGFFTFKPGGYYYIGSAKNGIAARINRHIKSTVKHWHVDYLKARSKIIAAIEIPGSTIKECEIQKILSEILIVPIMGFGSSDCKCSSHLLYSENIKKGITGIQKRLKSNCIQINYLQFE